MKKLPSVKAFMAIIAILLVNIMSANVIDGNKRVNDSDTIIMGNSLLISNLYDPELLKENKVNNALLVQNEEPEIVAIMEEVIEEEIEEPERVIVYDGMTLEELGAKLEKNLKSTLKGYGMVFAKYSIQYYVDPYISLAIVLHETGCSSGMCSSLTRSCNNVGGMKGATKCGNSSYAKFRTLDRGIEAFYKNLSRNYFRQGLNTPEKIGKKYAESESWAINIRSFMRKIKNS